MNSSCPSSIHLAVDVVDAIFRKVPEGDVDESEDEQSDGSDESIEEERDV